MNNGLANFQELPDYTDKDKARVSIAKLVERFATNENDYLQSGYNETQVRTEFITPLLEAFGWDVNNRKNQSLAYREVIQEANVNVEEERLSKRPDYELRIARQRKLFVEAKKPNVRIENHRASAFQTRRYGFSASLPISIVTNFYELSIYDCRVKPQEDSESHVARLHFLNYKEYDSCFDILWELLSYESLYSGRFDRNFHIDTARQSAQQFDDYFLDQIKNWRIRLAIDIAANAPRINSEELTYAVQIFLTRIIFLRICEDREIEKYGTLKNLGKEKTFDELMEILHRADQFYNSGIFNLINDETLGIRVSNDVLHDIISELYYPQSPYTFSVVKAEVLGEIYEQFLGDMISINNGTVEVINKPEIKEAGGVVPTPGFIAYTIVSRSLESALSGKSPEELDGFTVADICCGSGIFLLVTYEYLTDYYLQWYINDGVEKHIGKTIYDAGNNLLHLTFGEKRRILLTHVRGVDIDESAVEVAQFSLLLKLIENENKIDLHDYVQHNKHPALPDLGLNIQCGNSLISTREWTSIRDAMPDNLRKTINPFDWEDEFPSEILNGGFDVIVGNPPYIRIQKMVQYTPDEIDYLSDTRSIYSTAHQNNFDKYALFIERYLSLSSNKGRIGVIIPHKFMTIQSGNILRGLLTNPPILEEIVHFGTSQVFGRETSNYTCILIINKAKCSSVKIEQVRVLDEWRYGKDGDISYLPSTSYSDKPWSFVKPEIRSLFSRIRNQIPSRLETIANIEVGLQTSADKTYIIQEISSDRNFVTTRWNGQEWPIERGILRPCLHKVPIEAAYDSPKASAWIVFPYELVRKSNGKLRARVLQADELASHYPCVWKYLNAHRRSLEKRKITGGSLTERQWYQYGRAQSLTKFEQPRIVMSVLSQDAHYAYDDTKTLFTGGGNGPYYMIRAKDDVPISTMYLLAILNHPLCEAMIRTSTSVFRGGYYSHGKQFIKDLPIPIPHEDEIQAIEQQAKTIINAVEASKSAHTPHDRTRHTRKAMDIRRQLEDKVSALFKLSSNDISTISTVPKPE